MTEQTFVKNGKEYIICIPSIPACTIVALATAYKFLTGCNFDESWIHQFSKRVFIGSEIIRRMANYNLDATQRGGQSTAFVKNGGMNQKQCAKFAVSIGLFVEVENHSDPFGLLNAMHNYGDNSVFICRVVTNTGQNHVVLVPPIVNRGEIIVLDYNGGLTTYSFPDYEFGVFRGRALRVWYPDYL